MEDKTESGVWNISGDLESGVFVTYNANGEKTIMLLLIILITTIFQGRPEGRRTRERAREYMFG